MLSYTYNLEQVLKSVGNLKRIKSPVHHQIERRFHRRVDVDFSVQYRTEHKAIEVPAINLSQGGIFILSSHILPIGTPIEIIITTEDDHIFIVSTVCWSDGQGMGITFPETLNKDQRTLLANIVLRFANR